MDLEKIGFQPEITIGCLDLSEGDTGYYCRACRRYVCMGCTSTVEDVCIHCVNKAVVNYEETRKNNDKRD